jgi:hypothetical protein
MNIYETMDIPPELRALFKEEPRMIVRPELLRGILVREFLPDHIAEAFAQAGYEIIAVPRKLSTQASHHHVAGSSPIVK